MTSNWLFVGAPLDDSIAPNVGSVYVFRREGPTEFVFHQKIDSPDPSRTPRFGSSIATEGNDLFIGGPTADGAFEAEGAVFHFELVDGLWVLRQEITHDDHPDRGDYFGSAISLHGDTLAVSAHLKRTPTTFGVVYVFERGVDGQWSQRARLIPETLSSPFGISVATDGSRIVAGADGEYVDEAPLGAAHVFDLSCEICRPDLDADGALTIFDFLTFLNLFEDGEAAADFDGDGELTIFDFLAFQTAFDAGCE
ncbi:MAG: GC-type dockerin domain-anchored protein [Phycisphaerales bacterium JB064]